MEVEIPYDPREEQLQIHKNLKRFSVLVCHRRMGKSTLAINQLLIDALRCDLERPRFAYIAPLYKQAKQIIWDLAKHYSRDIPGVKYNESELRVDLPNGGRITLYGADNPDALRGIYLDGVVFDEYAQMNPKIWTEVVRPALADRKGYAIWIGTPQGHNAFYDLYERAREDPGWFTALYKASETGIVDEQELEAAKKEMGQDEYMQEFECSFEASIKGAYFADQIREARDKGRICAVPHEEHLLVNTAWDLGFDDATAIIFYQIVGKEIRLIDYEEHSGESLQFYAKLLQEKPYRYEIHNLPHDAAAKRLEGAGKSIEQQLWDLGVTGTNVVPVNAKSHSIQRVRSLFSRFWLDNSNERTKHMIECITQYHKEWDDDRKIFKSKPEHDWSSHCNDALQQLALSFEEQILNEAPIYKDYSGGRLGI